MTPETSFQCGRVACPGGVVRIGPPGQQIRNTEDTILFFQARYETDETFRARIVLIHGGDDYEVDARPSDAIALAVRTSAPIFATEAVLDRAGVFPEAEEDEKLSVFREFVNSLEGEAPAESDTRPPDDRDALGAPDDEDDRPLDDRLGDEPEGSR